MLNKAYLKQKFFFKRDFAYKAKTSNIHQLIKLESFTVTHKFSKNLNYFESISSFIILFNLLPYVAKPRKKDGPKSFQKLSQIKQTISCSVFFNLLMRIKSGENFEFNQVLLSDSKFIKILIKPNSFYEFLELYEYFPDLSDICVSCVVNHCKNQEEKKLLVSGMIFS